MGKINARAWRGESRGYIDDMVREVAKYYITLKKTKRPNCTKPMYKNPSNV